VSQSCAQCPAAGAPDRSLDARRSEGFRQARSDRDKKKAVIKAYAELIAITRTTIEQGRHALDALRTQTDPDAQRLVHHLTEFLPLVERAIEQAVRRVLHGVTLAAEDKIVRLFEPHTQIIRRGKAPPHDTEFGHKLNYAEVEHGLISDWTVIAQGNPPDAHMLPPFLRQHRKRFGHAPRVLAGDRGVFSPANERFAHRMGVAQVVLPQTGPRTAERVAHEKQRWFKKGQRFRNGIEGRISVVTRTVQLKRCPYHGLDGFERWVGWGILVANLVVIARTLHKRRHRKSRNVKVQK
jgi:IS5 family transposase